MGIIELEKKNNILTSKIRLKPILFIHFNQSITTIIDKNEYPVSESLITRVNNQVLNDFRTFNPKEVIYRQTINNKSNITAVSASTRPLSGASLLHFFVSGYLAKNTSYPVFIPDKIVSFLYFPSEDNQATLLSTDNKYELLIKYKKIGIRNIPTLIMIKKYIVYGIRWDIFKLTLLEYKVKKL